jgi:hypothetical protein
VNQRLNLAEQKRLNLAERYSVPAYNEPADAKDYRLMKDVKG